MWHSNLLGETCFTTFEEQRLISSINILTSVQIRRISGRWLYYLNLRPGCSPKKIARDLLNLGEQETGPQSPQSGNFVEILVVPRYISPWSSQATSIAHVCGFQKELARIEKGRYMIIELDTFHDLEQILAVYDHLHNRMTEILTLKPPNSVTIFADRRNN